jgi:site-specific DNA recombinase
VIAAIYARKSTDQNVPDEEKSVTRQIERARAYAEGKGWTVGETHIYTDDGISGAEFLKRPGFLRLMNALKPRPPFHILVMSEESRLGREQIGTAYALKQITDAGVRVFFYLEDRERTLDSAMDKVMLSLSTFAAEMEREKARQRTYDAIRRKVERGQVAGGIVYGYDNVEVASPTLGPDRKTRRDHVLRRINEAQAEVVRRIFQHCADGWGLVRIAKALTTEGVAKPKGRGRGWAPSAIREMLYRDLYRGQVVWNKMRRVDRGGTRRKEPRPESEWLTFPAEHLRVVSEALWRAAHASLEAKQAAYARVTGGRLVGRPEGSRESPYLLTGISRCGLCGGSIYALRRTHGRHERFYYGCFYHRSRGALVCSNGLTAPQDEINALVLKALRCDVLVASTIEEVLTDAISAWQERASPAAEREELEARLRQLDTETRNLTDALASGAPVASIRAALQARDNNRIDVLAHLEHLDGLGRVSERLDGGMLREDLGQRLADWQELLQRQPVQARQILKKLIADRLTFEPFEDKAGAGYRIRGEATYGRLIAGVISVVPPG